MSSAIEYFNAGRLGDAIVAASVEHGRNPNDLVAVAMLVDLLCFDGDLTEAERVLEAYKPESPETMMFVQTARALIRAEKERQRFFQEGGTPSFSTDADGKTELMQKQLELCERYRLGEKAEASALLEKLESLRPTLSGTVDGEAFTGWRDLDDLNSTYLELFSPTGKYYWIPMSEVRWIEFSKPARPRDLYFRSAKLKTQDTLEVDVCVPVLYAGSGKSKDEKIKLGRSTDWIGTDGEPIRGIGQRMFLFGDVDKSILEITRIELPPREGAEGT